MKCYLRSQLLLSIVLWGVCVSPAIGQEISDRLREAQFAAVETKQADWAHWGTRPEKFSDWTNHSNRLVPVYIFGGGLTDYAGVNSAYRDPERIASIYGYLPQETLNETAEYFDQTDIYRLQMDAIKKGKKHIIVMIFDGMDWQTTQAAAIYRQGKVTYESGRGNGLHFQDYTQAPTAFGAMVTSAMVGSTKLDLDRQLVLEYSDGKQGGYSVMRGGPYPWSQPRSPSYLLGQTPDLKHVVTDSASSATSMFAGIKTYNSAINVTIDSQKVTPIARDLQLKGFKVGVVTSVPISHATPAAAYANNVERDDYQDLTRDLLGVPSITHPLEPLAGVDVLLGCGWGENRDDEFDKQGLNFVPGNRYLAESDLNQIDVKNGGKYRVVQRTTGQSGPELLSSAAEEAAREGHRLFGLFGIGGAHLPYQTADGRFDPTRGQGSADRYTPEDLFENPNLAEMTRAALQVLPGKEDHPFWLMIEAGDVDWANHNNNLDDSIGAVFSGEAAFRVVTEWVEQHSSWDETLVIVTADHGHFLNVLQPEFLAEAGRLNRERTSLTEADSAESKSATVEVDDKKQD